MRRLNKTSLRIALLTMEPGNHSNKQIIKAGQQCGHVIEQILTADCSSKLSSPHLYYNNEPMPPFDAIIPRIGAPITAHGTSILRQFELQAVYCLNNANAITHSRDKKLAYQLLAKHGLKMPVTAFRSSAKNIKDLMKLVGGAPLVVKPLQSSKGEGVKLARTESEAVKLIEGNKEPAPDFLIQQFISEAEGTDIRCLVLGDKVIAAMQRTAIEGEFRANIHLGGSAKAIKITVEEQEMAIKASKVFDLELAGVDILRSNNGPLIVEVNSSPGLEAIERVTNQGAANKIIKHIENRVFTPQTTN